MCYRRSEHFTVFPACAKWHGKFLLSLELFKFKLSKFSSNIAGESVSENCSLDDNVPVLVNAFRLAGALILQHLENWLENLEDY